MKIVLPDFHENCYQIFIKILLPDFHAKVGRQYIFKPTNGNENSHNNTNDNGAKVVKHNSQLFKGHSCMAFHFCLSH